MPTQYCTPSDVTTFAIPASAIPASITTPMIVAACIAASGEADSSGLRGRYGLTGGAVVTGSYAGGPGVYDPTIVRHTAYIAGFILMSQRGFMPMSGADQMIRENYYKAVGDPHGVPGNGFFPGVERQRIHPDVTVSSTPQSYALPQVYSRQPRGI